MKTKVPKDYFIEMSNELSSAWAQAKNDPKRQLKRIKSVIDSGKDYEVMLLGTTEHEIPLEQLMKYYIDAKKVDVQALKNRWTEFVSNHEIDPNAKGDLKSAKNDVLMFAKDNAGYKDDEHNFMLLHETSHKYFLCEKQMDSLMEYMMALKLID